MDQLLTIGPVLKWPRTGAIYSRLFKYTQQQTAGFNCSQLGPAPPKATPDRKHIQRGEVIDTVHIFLWNILLIPPNKKRVDHKVI